MKLSIIIPVYDERPYIRRCLDSVKASEEVEVIVIDDESLDGSYEIEQTYADRFEIIRYTEHVGVSAARNSGIYESKGEYITFLDSDDALASDGVQTLLDVIDSHPDSDIIQMNHKRCSGGICRIEQKFSAKNGYYPVNNLPPKWAPVWNKIYRKEFIENNRIRFPEGQQFDEDRRFNIQCLKHAGGFQMDERAALLKYFENKHSLCHTMDSEKMANAIRGLADMLRDEEDPEIANLIRKSIIMHLNSNKFAEAFGGLK